jgi:hypothetical protein
MFSLFVGGDNILPFVLILAICSYCPICYVNSWDLVIGPVDLVTGENDDARLMVFIGSTVVLVVLPLAIIFT